MLVPLVVLAFGPLLFASSIPTTNLKKNKEFMHPCFESNPKAFFKNDLENTAEYWNENAQATVLQKVNENINTNIAKNVILFLGDGMSIPTVSAARVYIAGEEEQLSFEKFPHTALSKTYAVDRQVADSANTATAYLCGIKANYGTIGVSAQVLRSDCEKSLENSTHAYSIAYHSQKVGKKTGLITTARVTHASPAGVYAHTANRDWEAKSDESSKCPDIARQLVYGETGAKLDLILGGGKANFLPADQGGARTDGEDLINSWVVNNLGKFVSNRSQLLNLDDKVEKVLGLFSLDHMDYNLERDNTSQPSLAEMVESAIEILGRNNENGWFLFVEGARIDMAHHDAWARKALDETAEFSKAIQKAADLTDEEDTLIVVTADHAHTLSYSGYAQRGNDIFQFGGKGDDGKVYTTLNYANGPGYKQPNEDGSRYDLSLDHIHEINYKFPGVAPIGSETHGGDDVGVYARGPWSHLFSGVIEQNVIPHLMMYASCVGEGAQACKN